VKRAQKPPHSARMTVSSRLLFTVFPRGDDSAASGSRADCLNIAISLTDPEFGEQRAHRVRKSLEEEELSVR
jgi:hypothetical protein